MGVSYQEFISYLSKYKNEKRAIFSKNILKTNKDVLGLKMKEIKDTAKVFSDISFIDFDLNLYIVLPRWNIYKIYQIKS